MSPLVHKRVVLGLLFIGFGITALMLSGCSVLPVMKKTAYETISGEVAKLNCKDMCKNGCEQGKKALLEAVKAKLGL